MAIKALMVDVDGVLIEGKPEDAQHWSTSLETDLGVRPEDLHREFFDVYWNDVVLGRSRLQDCLPSVLANIAPHLTPDQFLAYWFERDSRLDRALLEELATIRSMGISVYLATNQEHLRATYLMQSLGLSEYVDGIHYSAQLGWKKPHPEFFHAVASAGMFRPSELLLIDDAPANIAAAGSLGWNTLHWGKNRSPQDIHKLIR